MMSALREEKREALEAVVAMHNQSLAAFREDLNAQTSLHEKLKEEALLVVHKELEAERCAPVLPAGCSCRVGSRID